MKLRALCSLVLLLAPALAIKSYAGYQVLQTAPLDDVSIVKLAPLLHRPEFDFWSSPRVGSPVEIMASPEHVSLLRSALAGLGLQPTVLVPDVGVTIENERAEIERMKLADKKAGGRAPALDRFLPFEEIQAYLDEVVATFPSIATIINIGTSTEGRPLRVLKLSNGPGKTGIFFDSVMHAREWAGPPVVMYAINELTENLAANQAMLDKNDFYFLPVANPDGYVFTWVDTRLWRKTRSPNAGSTCIGTDPNRNFDQHWAEGGIPSACDDTFPGANPFSEPEAKALADFLLANPSITFYCAVHSYGQYLLYPWGHTNALPPNVDDLDSVANEAHVALQAIRGTTYQIGTAANVLYFAYGTSHDWAYEGADISLSYTIELPGGGAFGFNPPPSAIGPVTTETWEAIKVFATNIPPTRIPLP